jgi:hypothetical protein
MLLLRNHYYFISINWDLLKLWILRADSIKILAKFCQSMWTEKCLKFYSDWWEYVGSIKSFNQIQGRRNQWQTSWESLFAELLMTQ